MEVPMAKVWSPMTSKVPLKMGKKSGGKKMCGK